MVTHYFKLKTAVNSVWIFSVDCFFQWLQVISHIIEPISLIDYCGRWGGRGGFLILLDSAAAVELINRTQPEVPGVIKALNKPYSTTFSFFIFSSLDIQDRPSVQWSLHSRPAFSHFSLSAVSTFKPSLKGYTQPLLQKTSPVLAACLRLFVPPLWIGKENSLWDTYQRKTTLNTSDKRQGMS